MKLKYIIPSVAIAAAGLGFSGCTDDFEEINTNPHKVYDVELNDVFAGTVQRTANNWAEMNYRRFLNFSRLTIVMFCCNPSQDTGDGYFRNYYVNVLRDLIKLEREYAANVDNEGRTIYPKNMAIVKAWKSYVYYVMASCWGPIPMSDAIVVGNEGKRYYKYDSEEQVYTQILNDLREAVDLLDHTQNASALDVLQNDPIFGAGGIGAPDMDKWLRFANTLRLNVAMHCQNLNSDLSREHALEVLADGRLMASNDDNAVMQWGLDSDKSSSYYYRSFQKDHKAEQGGEAPIWPCLNEYGYIYFATFNDPRIGKYVRKMNERNPKAKPFLVTDTLTRPHSAYCKNSDTKMTINGQSVVVATKCANYTQHRSLPTAVKNTLRDSIIVRYTVDYAPYQEQCDIPNSWRYATVPGMTYTYHDVLGSARQDDYNHSVAQPYFVSEDAHWVILTYADACFLRAEAELIYNNNPGRAKTAYEEGIDASMAQWGITDYADFKAQDGVKWGTSKEGSHDRRLIYQAKIMGGDNGNDGLLEQIYKQRSFADYFNGLEIWNIERRTRTFDWPPTFTKDQSSGVLGASPDYNYWMERLIYPEAETTKNSAANAEGIAMLQSVSPFVRTERWGDNIFTSLGFAKKNPHVEDASLWGTPREITPKMEYYEHYYGDTYEKLLARAKEISGARLEAAALGAVAFEYQSTKAYGYNLTSGN